MINKRKSHFFRKQEKFSIRKFKVGVASALIGATFLFVGNSASAEEAQPTEVATTAVAEEAQPTEVATTAVAEEAQPTEVATTAVAEEAQPTEVATTAVAEEVQPTVEPVAPVVVEVPRSEVDGEFERSVVTDKPSKPVTRGYKATNTVPETSATERPSNEGEEIPTGTNFRADTSTLPAGYTVTKAQLKGDYAKFNVAGHSSLQLVESTVTGKFLHVTTANNRVYVTEFEANGTKVKQEEIPDGGAPAKYFNAPNYSAALDKFDLNEYHQKVTYSSSNGRVAIGSSEKHPEPKNLMLVRARYGLTAYEANKIAYSTVVVGGETTQSTYFVVVKDNTTAYTTVEQNGREGDFYTTVAKDKENYDVVVPFNANGIVNPSGYTGVGYEITFDRASAFTSPDGKQQKITYRVINEAGDVEMTVYKDGKAVPVYEFTGRFHTMSDGRQVPIYRLTGKTSGIVKRYDNPQDPYKTTLPIVYDLQSVKDYDKTLKDDGVLKEGETVTPQFNAHPGLPSSNPVVYYYTQEKAEVVFRDVTNGESNAVVLNDYLRDPAKPITVFGKGQSAITKDIVNAQTRADINALIERYKAKGYELVVDGFNANPTFNQAQGDGKGGTVKPSYATPDEKRKADEVKREEANKKVIRIDLRKIAKGDVKVNYIDETTRQALIPEETDTPSSPVGTAYNVADSHKKTEIKVGGKEYVLVPAKSATRGADGSFTINNKAVANETGTVVAGTTYVNYVYKEKAKGNVVVDYVDTTGTAITGTGNDNKQYASGLKDTTNAYVGTAYDTQDHKPTTITTADNKVYEYVEVKSGSATETGQVKAGTQKVTYVYRLRPEAPTPPPAAPKGNVVVSYVDETGRVIATSVNDTVNADVNTAYDTTDHRLAGITKDGKEYVLVPTKTATTTDGVSFTNVREEAPVESGNVTEGTTYVTYVYKEKEAPTPPPAAPKGNVVVSYVDETGRVIATSVNDTVNADVNTAYDTTDYRLAGITKDGKEYVLVPTKTATTTDGVSFTNVREEAPVESGNVTEGTTYVTYVYKEKEAPTPPPAAPKGNVVVSYVDETGRVIATSVNDTVNADVNTAYDTTDYRLAGITKDGKEYVLVPTKTATTTDGVSFTNVREEAPVESGNVTEGTTYVTYVYKEKEAPTPPPAAPKGNVVVSYVDETGRVIATSVNDTVNADVNTAYDTTDYRLAGITKDGKEYVLVPTKTATTTDGVSFTNVREEAPVESGNVTEGTTYVTYVYKEKEAPTPPPAAPKGNVVVSYVDETGRVIATSVNDTVNADVNTAYDTTDYRLAGITKDGKEYVLVPTKTATTTDGVSFTNVREEAPVESGNVTEGTTYVTYVYKEKEAPTPPPVVEKGTVIVKYRDVDGNPLKDPVTDEDNVAVGTDYNTTDEGDKPTTIVHDGENYVLVPSLTEGNETGKVTKGTTVITYVYQKVGNWIPLIPGEPNPPKTPYPFNPDRPGDPIPAIPDVPGQPGVPVVPHVPGYEPEIPLVPVDPENPNKGYIPPVPEVPGKDTLIPYVPAKGTVIVKYRDVDGNPLKDPVTDEDNVAVGTDYNTTDEGDKPTTIVHDGENYVLVPSLTEGNETGKVTKGTTVITYVYQKVGNWIPLIPGEPNPPKTPYPFNPDRPGDPIPAIPDVPGQPGVPVVPHVPGYEPEIPLVPVDPENPNKGYIPPVPEVPGKDTLIPYVPAKGTVIVKYRDVDGNPLKDPVTDEDNVAVGTDYNTTDEGDKPTTIVHDGENYVLVPSLTEGNETGKVTKGTTVITYVYQKVGNWIPLIPGEPNPPKTPYPFNPDRPGDPIPAIPDVPGQPGVPVVPHVPGYEPEIPLVPVDPENPNKGYIPPVPEVPGKDTLIPYVPAKGTVIVKYRDVDGNPLKDPVTDEDNVAVGTDYNTTDEGDKPTTIVHDGENYVLVPSLTEGNETGKVTKGTTVITYVYQKVGNWIPLIPGEPNPPKTPYPFNPDRPGDPIPAIPDVPGQPGVPVVPHVPGYEPEIPLVPVDPENPNKGYIPPVPEVPGKDTLIPYVPAKGTVIVKYRDVDGNPLKDPVTDEDNVAVGTDYNTTDEGDKPTTIVHDGENYVLVPSLTEGNETGKVTKGTTVITYVYQKVGNWIPLIPGEPNPPKTPYPFNPDRPGDPIPAIPDVPGQPGVPVVPHVPGYEPEIPLVPVDPENPNKGYIPPVPEVPGKDTLIPYVPAKGTVIVKYRDVDGNPLKDPVTDEDNVAVGTDYNTTDEGDKPTTIVHDGENYVLVPSLTEGNETGKVTKGTTVITYVYQKVGNWIPLIPGEPNPPKTPYPFNPDRPGDPIPAIPDVPGQPGVPVVPHVPGYEPEIPLVPVDPENPNKGYIPPVPEVPGKDTLIPYVPAKGTVIVKYRDVDGNPLKDPVTDEDNVAVGTDYNTTDEGDKPTTIVHDGENYVLVPSLTEGNETGKVTKGTTVITYVYQKVGNWIPLIPGEPNPPKTPYPFNPDRPGDPIPAIPDVPGQPGVPVVPHVPGYEPEIPLVPVDPENPNKGYIPPVPEVPGKDTLIPYVPAKGTVIVKYRDVDGNPLKDPVTDEDNVAVGTDYNTTDEGDKPTTIVHDGENYVLVPSLTEGNETGKVTKGTTVITYVYQKVGNWIPLIPGEPNPPKTPYPFNPDRPGDPIPAIPDVPGQPGVPVVPHVPGYEPEIPLVPVDPENPNKGYIPPVPEVPGKDTLIPYVPAKGTVIVKYRDVDGNPLKDPVTDEDNVAVGTDYNTTDEGDKPTTIVHDGENYVLVPSLTEGNETGKVTKGTTVITYVYQKVGNWIPLIPGEPNPPKTPYPFNPDRPGDPIPAIPDVPGQPGVPVVPHVPGYEPEIPLVPVDPENPNKGYIPPVPEVPGKDTLIPYVPAKGTVIVKYRDVDGNPLKDPVTDEDNVAVGTDYNTTDEGDKPTTIVHDGENYVLVPSLTEGNETGKVTKGTTVITYVYQKVGNWIPLIPGEPNPPKTPYPFNPDRPGDPIPAIPDVPGQPGVPVVPHVPGYEPEIPLVPVDPENPNKGYIPPVPEVPGKDTLIPYVPAKGTVIVKYRDVDGNPLKDPVTDEDNVAVGTDYNTTDEGDKPTTIVHDGENYVLVPSLTEGNETGKVTKGTTVITYVYQKVGNWIPLIPGEPNPPKTPYPFNPDRPGDPIPAIPDVPGQPGVPVVPHVPGYEPEIPLVPVDPENPNKGYIPPVPEVPGKDTLIPYVPAKGTVIVKYRDVDGNPLKDPVTDEDNVAVGTDYNTTDEGDKPTTIVHDGENYVLVPSLTEGNETGKVTKGTTVITYVYQKVGNWIPLIPGEPNPPKTPYPFNPDRPGDPIPAIPDVPGQPGVPVVPHVPGYEPEIPLVPVDPENPNKGYIPPVPEVPGKDTLIPYVPAKGTVIVKYRDVDGNPLKDPVTDEDNVAVGTDYNTTDEGDKPTTIVHDGENYVLVPSLTEGNETGKVTKGTTVITYVYQKVGNWIPEIPGVPDKDRPRTPYPFNPDKPGDPIPLVPEVPGKPGVPVIPYVPGHEPVDPSNPTDPLKPVDPTDPNKGYIPPSPETPGRDTRIPYVQAYGTIVVAYKDVDGNVIKPPVTDEDNVLVDTPYNTTDEGDKPTEIVTEDGTRYVLIPSLTEGNETGKVTKGTTTITYVYQKVGNWIPLIPGEPNPPKTPYPFNPDKPGDPIPAIPEVPGKPGVPVIPYVPGYEPEIPLVPVDPTDPNKGYIPPVPEVPGKDTPITYVQAYGTIVVAYKDVDGNVIKPPVTDEDNVLVDTPYNTTDEGDKPTEIVTEDGTRYVLIPSLTEGNETGKVTKGTTTITYVYQKVGNWIPLIPGEPNPPKTPYPFNPDKPGDPIPAIPEVPGKPGVPVIPYVPGYEPEIPLVPVDPTDPNKGYIPPVPEVPGKDTPIPYVPVPPVTPELPQEPGEPTPPATPEKPQEPGKPTPPAVPNEPTAPSGQLPETGEVDAALTFGAAAMAILAGLGLVSPRKKEEE